MKKLAFDVVVGYQREDYQTDTLVTIEREKTFSGAESYQAALDYYEKHKQAADRRYTMDEAGLYSCEEVDGKKYVGEYCEFYTPRHAWVGVSMRVRVMNC